MSDFPLRFRPALRRLAPLSLLGIGLWPLCGHAEVVSVPPGPAEAITAAVRRAKPGDVIQLAPGVYQGTVVIQGAGAPDNPITIAGPAGERRAVIDGGAKPAKGLSNQAFQIKDSSWIVIRDLDTQHCWTNVIDIWNSSYLTVQGCHFIEGGNTGISTHDRTHHVLMEHCDWSQTAKIFETWDWADVHSGKLDVYNGGCYGGTDAAGGCVIRFNTIHDCFNGLRWDMRPEGGQERKYQANIEIYGNSFNRCRDNCIEPERFAWNLHLYHNLLNNCGAGVFSVDGVLGGKIWAYGNTGHWDPASVLGPKHGHPAEQRPWCVYKFSSYAEKFTLDEPFYIYNNSWNYGITFPHGGKERKGENHILHENNAYLHLPNATESGIGLNDWPGQECRFDYDLSSQPWTDGVAELGAEKHGIPNTDPKFRDPAAGDFRLGAGSPAIDAGRVHEGFTLWYVGQGPDIGAFEGDQLQYAMPFLQSDPPGGGAYQERPRIVRIFARGQTLGIFFSSPLQAGGFSPDSLQLSAGGTTVAITAVHFPDAQQTQAVSVTLDRALPLNVAELGVRFGKSAPKGMNGESATLWAADARIVRVPQNAKVVGSLMSGLFPEAPVAPRFVEAASKATP